MELSSEQAHASDLCSDTDLRIACVTGQAGTGKTTILKDVYQRAISIFGEQMDSGFSSIRLCAPTGRAAKRIEEATGLQAETIHKMLRFSTPQDDDEVTLPRHDKYHPLPCKVVLVDESSMIPDDLWRAIIDALPRTAVIRFFGDINQLPPIYKEGKSISPFAVALRKHPTAYLSHNYRSDDGIVAAADRVIKARMPLSNDRVAIHGIKGIDVTRTLTKLCDDIDFTSLDRQIITPTNTTKYGCVTINNLLQQRYNPEIDKIQTFKKDPYEEGGVLIRSFKRNDKIIWTKNDYNLDIMNGTTGTVVDFDHQSGNMMCRFDDKDILIPSTMQGFNPTTGETYPYDPRLLISLGYAVSTHKAQGSQFSDVIYVVSRSRAATRQNVYTGLTRAKNNVIILNISGALSTAIDTLADLGV